MRIIKSKPDQFTPLAQVRPDLDFVLHVFRGESTGAIQRVEPDTTGSGSQAVKRYRNGLWLFEGLPLEGGLDGLCGKWRASLVAQQVKESACKAGATGDMGSAPGSGRSPGGGHDNPLQGSCLENPLDRGAWRATAHGVVQSRAQLSD